MDLYTANIYSQFTVIGCVTFPTVIWQWLSQPTAVPMTLSDIEEYSLRSIAVLGCNMHSQIAVGNVTLPKAVLSSVKIFAMHLLWIPAFFFQIICKKRKSLVTVNFIGLNIHHGYNCNFQLNAFEKGSLRNHFYIISKDELTLFYPQWKNPLNMWSAGFKCKDYKVREEIYPNLLQNLLQR